MISPATAPQPPRAEDDPDQPDRVVRLTVSAQLKRTGKEMKFVAEGGGGDSADPSLVRLLVRARVLRKRLTENPDSTLEEIAAREYMGGPNAARLIRLNCLAPDIVASILNGKQPADLTANKLIADTRLPLDWRAQVCLTASSPLERSIRTGGANAAAVPPKIDFET